MARLVGTVQNCAGLGLYEVMLAAILPSVKWESGLKPLFLGVLMFIQAGVVNARAGGSTNFPLLYTPPALKIGAVTNGQIQLTLFGEPGMTYVIEASSDMSSWTPVATNTASDYSSIINLPLSANQSFFRAWRNPVPIFAYALATQGNINLNGNGISTSSWNSHDTNQSNNGLYNGFTGTNGNVACVSGLINVGNHYISGSVYLGRNASFLSSASQISGQLYFETPLSFPDAVLPSVSWLPAPITNGGTAGHMHDFTASGNYSVTDSYPIVVEAGVTAVLHVTTTNFVLSGININGGTTNSGTLIIYQDSSFATFSGNGSGGAINNRPENFIYFGLPGVTSITLAGLSPFTGVIYAPEATLIANGGSSTSGVLGACVINSITLNGHFTFYFDEGLLSYGPFR